MSRLAFHTVRAQTPRISFSALFSKSDTQKNGTRKQGRRKTKHCFACSFSQDSHVSDVLRI